MDYKFCQYLKSTGPCGMAFNDLENTYCPSHRSKKERVFTEKKKRFSGASRHQVEIGGWQQSGHS